MQDLSAHLEQIRSALNEGRLEDARLSLKRFEPRSISERRTAGHYAGLVLFHEARPVEACTQMQDTLRELGPNVNLLRDLAACQYHLGDMISFRSNLSQLEKLVVDLEAQLSARTLFECELLLGKFLEQEARLAPALQFYERALSHAQTSVERLRSLLLKARWLATYEPTQELSALYRELISYPTDHASQDLRVELEHALMLIEQRLVGAEHAWQRVLRMDPRAYEFDQRLLIFDFLEGALAQELEVQSEVLQQLGAFKTLSPFESYLQKLILEPLEYAVKIQELTRLSSQLAWSDYLRLLCLTANREPSVSAKQELNRKIQLIVCSLDLESQALWNSRLKQARQTPEIRVEVSLRARTITIQGKVIDLSKKKMGLQTLEGLLQKSTLSVDEAIERLWQTTFSPEHYHRLRMGIHRLNTLVHEHTGLGKIIEVDSQNVRLRPEVSLKQTEDSFEVGVLSV